MLLLALSGQRGAALAQYETCRQVLAEELGVEPGPETTALYRRIRDGELDELRPSSVPTQPAPLPAPRLPAFLESEEDPALLQCSLFIGRERELAQLDGFLEDALAGRGGVAFVIGEAGQGKTCLLRAFARRALAAHPELAVATGTCDIYTGLGDSFLPFRDILGTLTGDVEAQWATGAITRDHALRLWRMLPDSVQALLEHGPDLIDTFVPGAALAQRAVAFATDGTGWLTPLEEWLARRGTLSEPRSLDQDRVFQEYLAVLQALANRRPLLLFLDDLHWADLSSVSLLSHLGWRIAPSRILIVAAYRQEDLAEGRAGGQHPLSGILSEFKRHFGDVWVDLDQGEPGEGREFIDALLDSERNRLGEDFRQQLVRTTEGHPLFTVELLRDLEERGALRQDDQELWVVEPDLVWDSLPARVEGVVQQRIGRLDVELRRALTVASVEGEAFTAEVIAQVRKADQRALVRRLSSELDKQHRLIVAQGIQQRGSHGQRLSSYQFRHNLFQKYLYNSLDEVERAYLHEAVGNVLERLYGEDTQEVAVQLARHFQVAGILDKAIDYLVQAGERAVRLSAYEEAIAHFTRALALLQTFPDEPERLQQELTLQIALGNALKATQGFGASEVGKAFTRARELSRHVRATPQVFPALWGLWEYYLTRAEHQTARELGERLVSLADAEHLLQAQHTLWTSCLPLGEFSSARMHSEQGIALYDPQEHHLQTALYGEHDPGVCCLSFGGIALWALGFPDQALQRLREALELAQGLSHPLSVALSLNYLSTVHQLRREARAAHDTAETAVTISTEQGFALVLGVATCAQGWALAQLGQAEEGIAYLRRGLDVYLNTGAAMDQTHLLALLAEAYGIAGQTGAGLDTIAKALEAVHTRSECHYEAELHRLKGELLRPQGEANSDAEACFRQAIEIARQQEARSLELRAVMSLSRLWHAQGAQGKREEAHQMLSEVYGWFSEGFDTPDLKEAEALLDELS
jgi:predicted ATPase